MIILDSICISYEFFFASQHYCNIIQIVSKLNLHWEAECRTSHKKNKKNKKKIRERCTIRDKLISQHSNRE